MDIKRIREMEVYLDECMEATDKLNGQLSSMEGLRSHMMRLFSYYGSEE